MMSLKKQVFGYNKSQVDELINEKDNEIKQLNDQIKKSFFISISSSHSTNFTLLLLIIDK